MKISLLIVAASTLCLTATLPAGAQKMNQKALEKSTWHTAPREFQIIDERPVVRDFRDSGPPDAGTIDLSGLHLNDPKPSFRSASGGGLPKSGFGGSNIPAGGFAQAGLPGVKRGALLPRSAGNAAAHAPAPARGGMLGNSKPTVSSYGGYGTGGGTPAASSSRTDTSVRGTLLRSK